MKRFLPILLVVIVVVSSWVLYSRGEWQANPAQLEGITTAKVTRGSLEATVDSTGTLSGERVQALSFSSSGTVVQVLANERDVVRTGQVLARLDTKDLELSVKQAQAALQVSEATLAKARKGPSAEDIAAARAALASATASLADLKTGPGDLDKQLAELSVAQAVNSLASARASLRDLDAGPTDIDKTLAELAISQAKNSLWGAQGNRDSLDGGQFTSGGAKTQAKAQVLNAELAVTIAELNRDKLVQGATDTAIAAARAQAANAEVAVKVAQVNRDKLLEAPKESVLANAETQVAQAESTLASLLSRPAAEDIAVAEAQVNQARVGVDIARSRLEDADLTAPFDGELVSWNLHPNDLVGPTVVVGTLADLSHYHIDVDIDETEISRINEGQEVHLTLDAFPDEQFQGRVTRVDTVGTPSQGIVNYGVRVDLAPTDLPVRAGMTAVISIVAESKESVLRVPNRAIKRDQQVLYVDVVQGRVLTRVNVTVGVANDLYTEITSGLSEGQDVVIGAPRVNPVGGGPFGG